jgi:hypothetical protein
MKLCKDEAMVFIPLWIIRLRGFGVDVLDVVMSRFLPSTLVDHESMYYPPDPTIKCLTCNTSMVSRRMGEASLSNVWSSTRTTADCVHEDPAALPRSPSRLDLNIVRDPTVLCKREQDGGYGLGGVWLGLGLPLPQPPPFVYRGRLTTLHKPTSGWSRSSSITLSLSLLKGGVPQVKSSPPWSAGWVGPM